MVFNESMFKRSRLPHSLENLHTPAQCSVTPAAVAAPIPAHSLGGIAGNTNFPDLPFRVDDRFDLEQTYSLNLALR